MIQIAMLPSDRVMLASVQGLRGLALLAVVLGHLSFVELKYGQVALVLYPLPFKTHGHAAVDTFFVISGFFIVYTTRGWFGSARGVLAFAYRRFTRIYPLWWFYSLLVLPVFLFHPHMVNSADGNQVNLFTSFLLLPDRHLPLIPVGWSLVQEIYFCAGFSLLLFLPERRLPYALLAWASFDLAMIALQLAIESSNPWLKLLGSPLNLEFLMGAAVALVAEQRLLKRPALAIAIGLILSFGGYQMYVSVTGNLLVDEFNRVLLYGVPACLYVYGLVSLELSGQPGPLSRLKWMGNSSYSTYLGHVLVISGLGRLWAQIGVPGHLPHALFLAVCLIASFVAGELSYRYLEKPVLRFAKRYDPSRRTVASEALAKPAVLVQARPAFAAETTTKPATLAASPYGHEKLIGDNINK